MSSPTEPVVVPARTSSGDVDVRPPVVKPSGVQQPVGVVSADESREIARLAAASPVVVFAFALASLAIMVDTGDAASTAAAVVQLVVVIASFQAPRRAASFSLSVPGSFDGRASTSPTCGAVAEPPLSFASA